MAVRAGTAAVAAQAATDYVHALPCRHYLWPLPATETAAVQHVHSQLLTWLTRRWTQCVDTRNAWGKYAEVSFTIRNVTSRVQFLQLNCDCILW